MNQKQIILAINVPEGTWTDPADRIIEAIRAGDYIELQNSPAIQAQIATDHLASEPSEDLARAFGELVKSGLVTGDQISAAMTAVQASNV